MDGMDSCEILFQYCEFADQSDASNQDIVKHRHRTSVVSMTFTKNKKNVIYFV